MGSIWLNGRTANYPSVLDVLTQAGVSVSGYPGWATRSRSTGGFEKLLGIVCHHTASNASIPADLNFMATGPGNPISNGLLDRTGHFTILGAGATNHAGRGGGSDTRPPWITSGGRVPQDDSNRFCFGIECANNGVGQPYPVVQQDAYTRMCAALCVAYRLDPIRDIRAHYEWTNRKCDPTGPSRFCTDNNTRGCNGACLWNMDAFRAEVQSLMGATPVPPTPTPVPPTPSEDDDTLYVQAHPGLLHPLGA